MAWNKGFDLCWTMEPRDWTVSALCGLYGISPKTGYKRISRYQANGMRQGSPRPLPCPHRRSPQWEDRIVYERLKHPRWAPRKIRAVVEDQGFSGSIPGASPMGNILDRVGLVRPRKSPRHRWPLREGERPNHVWAVTYKGWFPMQDGKRCDPLTVTDLYSLESRRAPIRAMSPSQGCLRSCLVAMGCPRSFAAITALPLPPPVQGAFPVADASEFETEGFLSCCGQPQGSDRDVLIGGVSRLMSNVLTRPSG